jgi:hypothetical protein
MIWVTMKDGRVIRYNTGGSYLWDNNRLRIDQTNGGVNIASIALCDVERVEFTRPCAMWDKTGKVKKVVR